MNDQEMIPCKALYKFDLLCLHQTNLQKDILLQKKILSWANSMLIEAREEWGKSHATTI